MSSKVQRELGRRVRVGVRAREAHAIRHGDAFQRHEVVGVGRGIQHGLRRLPELDRVIHQLRGVAEEFGRGRRDVVAGR